MFFTRRGILPAVERNQVVNELKWGWAQTVLWRRWPFSTAMRLLPVLLILLCVAGCHRQKADEIKPTKLIPPLYSGYSLEKVQHELNLKTGDWEVIEDRRPLVSDKRPPFQILSIAHKGLQSFGVSGELVMTFYNDRLMTTLFYPDELNALRRALAREASINFTAQGDAQIEPSTKVWIGKDHDGRSYIGWIDLELERRQNEWIEKYER